MDFFSDFNWIQIFGYILFMLLGAAVTYYKNRPKLIEKTEEAITWIERLRGKAAEYIAKAEIAYQGTKRGGEKFNWVVEQLYGMIPATIRAFISRETVENIVQGVFDSVEAYAVKQVDRWVNSTLDADAERYSKEENNAATDNAV